MYPFISERLAVYGYGAIEVARGGNAPPFYGIQEVFESGPAPWQTRQVMQVTGPEPGYLLPCHQNDLGAPNGTLNSPDYGLVPELGKLTSTLRFATPVALHLRALCLEAAARGQGFEDIHQAGAPAPAFGYESVVFLAAVQHQPARRPPPADIRMLREISPQERGARLEDADEQGVRALRLVWRP